MIRHFSLFRNTCNLLSCVPQRICVLQMLQPKWNTYQAHARGKLPVMIGVTRGRYCSCGIKTSCLRQGSDIEVAWILTGFHCRNTKASWRFMHFYLSNMKMFLTSYFMVLWSFSESCAYFALWKCHWVWHESRC